MYDLVVIGLGIYGSAVVAEAASKGLRVIGVDQFTPSHTYGSSHGGSRVLRLTTVEAEEYVPLAKRALDLWQEYSDGKLMIKTGFAIIAQQSAASQVHHGVNRLVDRAQYIAKRHHIAHESLSGAALMKRFPGLRIQPEDYVFYEPDACIIQPEMAIEILLKRAQTAGAVILTGKEAKKLEVKANGVKVNIGGQPFTAKHAIVCTGPWQHKKLMGLEKNPIDTTVLPQTVLRMPHQPLPREKQFPGFVYLAVNQPLTYGIPSSAGLHEIKLGIEQESIAISDADPSLLPQNFTQNAVCRIYKRAAQLVPEVQLENPITNLCYYTVTPNSKHIIRKFGPRGEITLVSACSGHGFKYAPAIAEKIVRSFLP